MNREIAQTPLRQVSSVKQLLHNNEARNQLGAVAAKHMSPERLMRITANAIRTTPKLQDAEPLSFLGALMQCSALGLEPNTILGHAYLIPFDNRRKKITEVQIVVGYKGLIDLARRSGHITSISANIHYSDDDLWEYEEGTEARLRHRPGPMKGEKLHAYAIAQFRDGGHAYVVMPWAQVMKIRDTYSQGYKTAIKYNKKDTPWIAHEDAMAKKTAIRSLAKYLPLSVEFIDAVQIDNDSGAHMDYASFAMNPDDGVTIDGEIVDEEDDVGQEDTQDDADPAPKEDPKPKTKAAPKKEAADDKADGPKPDASVEANSKFADIINQIEGDLLDGAPTDATRSFYAEQIADMKANAPDAHASVEKLLADFD
jgi:recombination protein RecT